MSATVSRPARVGLAETHGWSRRVTDGAVLWLKGQLNRGDPLALARARPVPDEAAVATYLAGLGGHFALVIEAPGWTLAAVDRARTVPLIYGGEPPVIDQSGPRLEAALGLERGAIDPVAALSFALAGYTIGDDTLYAGVRQLGPGSFALFRAGAAPLIGRYHRFAPWRPEPVPRSELIDPLTAVTEAVIDRLLASARGRPIAVPLSAGLDSRLIASGLVAAGYRQVYCFAYGQPGNHEAETSRAVAARLGVPWRFVPYTRDRLKAHLLGAEHAAYARYADSFTALYFLGDHPALVALAGGWLPDDAIVVNGQSGDFISGNHIPAELHAPRPELSREARRARMIEALLAKHFRMWGALATPANLERIRARLAREIEAIGGMPEDAAGDHGVYEWCEFQDRQTKYVINGQRLYEHLGRDWRLPLWDDDYLDFWARAPLEAKRNQALYRDMLARENWGGVWRDIPVNRKTIRPRWLVPLRLAAKAAHSPLGRARWHAFERRFLQYWMEVNGWAAHIPYRRVALDGRGHRSSLAFHVEAYLDAKGIGLDDPVLRGR